MAFVGHGSGRARARGLQLFYRSGPISTPREDAGVAHDGADELSPDGCDAGGSDAPFCQPGGERHCRAGGIPADDTAADDSGSGHGRHDAAGGVVEGAVGDREAAADYSIAGEKRENRGGVSAAVGGVVGVEKAVSVLVVG